MKLNPILREYFSKVFALAVKQNRGNELKIKGALGNFIPHTFGQNKNCDDYCQHTNDNTYIYKYFKDGKCLTDVNLGERLEMIIEPFINSVQQIAHCASRQSNESFNEVCPQEHFFFFFFFYYSI